MFLKNLVKQSAAITPEQQFARMTTQPVSKLIPSLAIPTVISMLISSIYNMADTFFVSQLGTSASAAVGIVFSVMAIIQACGFTLGMGAGSLISRRLGEKNNAAAERLLSTAFISAFICGSLIAVVGLSCTEPLMRLLGASETIMPYAVDYGNYIFLGAPLMCASFVMNNTLRSEGHAAFSMVALTTGGVLNMILDPIFIFVFDLGTAGAAIATLISQAVSFSIFISFFLMKKSIVRLHLPWQLKNRHPEGTGPAGGLGGILALGLPSLCRQGLSTVASVLLNRAAGAFGDAAIAGMSITNRIIMLVASVMIGIGQGFTPVSGYNYGAKKYTRVRQAYWFTVKLGATIMGISALVLVPFAPWIITFFRNDPEVIKIGTLALRFQAIALPLHAFIVGTNMLMQSTGKSVQATFLACNRQGVYFIPLIIVLPALFGYMGIVSTQAIADVFSAITAIPYVIWFLKRLPKESN